MVIHVACGMAFRHCFSGMQFNVGCWEGYISQLVFIKVGNRESLLDDCLSIIF